MSSPRFTSEELERSFPFSPEFTLKGPEGAALLDAIATELEADENRQKARRGEDAVRHRATLDALLANLLAATVNKARPDVFVALGFDRNDYVGTSLSQTVMTAARDSLLSRRLVEGQKGFQSAPNKFGAGPRTARRTRLRPTVNLRSLFEAYGVTHATLGRRPRDLIRMKEPAAGIDPKVEPADVQNSRSILARLNDRLAAAAITLPPEAWRRIGERNASNDEDDALRGQAGDLTQTQLFRAFVHDWRNGGRIYGGWFQSVPKEERSLLTIDGEPVVELDYARLHPTLLFHRAGLQLAEDIYTLPSLDGPGVRDLAKITFQRLINRSPKSGRPLGPMRVRPQDAASLPEGVQFKDFVAALEERCAPIRRWFGTGVGLSLQFEDSVLLLDVLERLERSGVLGLPVHDSVIVPASKEAVLREAMEQAFNARYGFTPKVG